MRKIFQTAALVICVSTAMVSCKKKVSDADLQTKVESVVGASSTYKVTIKDGVAHIEGTFADPAAKDKAIADVKAIEGVKDVMDMSTVTPPAPPAPVVSSANDNLQKIKDALKDFPKVKAEVIKEELTISGTVTKEQARKIKQSIDALKVGKVNFNYIVK